MHTHLLINFVTRTEGIPEGVLIRAIEPDEGIGAMNVNRGKSGYELTNGQESGLKLSIFHGQLMAQP